MDYKKQFLKWKQFVIYNSEVQPFNIEHVSVVLPCGERRVELWSLFRGGEAIYFDKKIVHSIIDANGNERKTSSWIEHNDFGPSRILSNGDIRYRIMGEDKTQKEWAEHVMLRLIAEVLNEKA